MLWSRRSRNRRRASNNLPKPPIAPTANPILKMAAAAAFEGLEPRKLLNGDGLKAQFFDSLDLTGSSITRIDSTVNFNWVHDSPDPVIAPDTFSARWTGQVQPQFSETYTFATTGDDGVRLWVNGQLLINDWNDHSAATRSGSIDLIAGQKYDIRMEYYENLGRATVALHWTCPSQPQQVIPTDRLFSNTSAAPTEPTDPDAPPNNAPVPVGSVASLTLIDADTDQPINQLRSADVLDLAMLPTRNLSIRADVSGSPIGSVRFDLNGKTVRAENAAPYVLSGDRSGDVHAWTPAVGGHTLTVTPFASANATGVGGAPLSLGFTVIDSATVIPPPVTPPPPAPVPVPTLPDRPTNLAAQATLPTSITLTWNDNSGDENAFIIERSADGQIFLPLDDVSANVNTYTDRTVVEKSNYWYRVAALNDVGISAYTAPLPVTTPATAPSTNPTPPSNDIPAVLGKIIYVSAGQSIDAALDSASPGDHVVLKPGVYKESISVSRSGAEGKPIVLRPETPGTVTIDATGKATALISSGASYIFISGLTISGANNTEAGNHNAAIRTGDNWVMQDCIVEKHAGGGMAVTGVNTVVRRIIAQDNGRYGIGGSGGRNILVQDCITRRNNRTIGDSNGGGGKFTRLDGAVIERLQAYENGGVGLWLDINNINVTVRDSEFHDNVTIYNPDGSRKIWGDGIDIEISGMVVNKEETAVTGEGPVVLENSRFWNNEHDGILAYASRNVIIRNNTVTDDHIYIKDGGRAPWGLSKLTVTGNTITRGFIQADGAVVNDYQSKEIVLDNNTFITSPILYKWSGTSYRTLDAVRTALGYELEGTVK